MLLRSWVLLVGVLAVSGPASAEVVSLSAALSGANEVPPIQSSGTGTATVTFDTQSREMRWEVLVQGLSAPLTAAHFHGPGSSTQNSPIIVPIAKAGDQSPFKGQATLTPEQAADLLGGRWYVNIHTQAHPPGEIRGQVTKR
jgi:hypothetical protein